MATALLFDRDRVDAVDDWTDSLPKVGRSAILWIDLAKREEDDVAQLVDAFDLEAGTATDLLNKQTEPRLADHSGYLHVTVIGLSDKRETVRVDCLVAERWLITVHDKPVEDVDRFRALAEGSGAVARWTRWVPLTGCRRAPGPFTIHLYGADRDGQR